MSSGAFYPLDELTLCDLYLAFFGCHPVSWLSAPRSLGHKAGGQEFNSSNPCRSSAATQCAQSTDTQHIAPIVVIMTTPRYFRTSQLDAIWHRWYVQAQTRTALDMSGRFRIHMRFFFVLSVVARKRDCRHNISRIRGAASVAESGNG